ncbi:MAG: calcium-binding protein [Vulcanococcus sp.]
MERSAVATVKPTVDSSSQGFSLVELLVATAAGALVLAAAGSLIVQQLTLNSRMAGFERLRETWAQAAGLLVAEAALSERMDTSLTTVSIPAACAITPAQFRFALMLRLDLPPVIYGVKSSPTTLKADNSLWRCGPSINDDGSYATSLSNGVVADGLDAAAAGGGLSAVITGSKQLEIGLTLKGNRSNFFQLTTASASRINPDFLTPREASLCVAANNIAAFIGSAAGDSFSLGTAGLACGGGGGDTLIGTTGNDVLEAGESGGATLSGGNGNDVLRGTNDADTLNGGSGDDVLIGRQGNDTLIGGSGTNQYAPGTGNDSIQGGSGLDIVFLTENAAGYTLSGACNQTSCTLTSTVDGSSKQLQNVEIVIFKDGRKDL